MNPATIALLIQLGIALAPVAEKLLADAQPEAQAIGKALSGHLADLTSAIKTALPGLP